MSKNKLTKFAELDALPNVLQFPFKVMAELGYEFPYKGLWGKEIFGNEHPIIVELGCGRGEYTVALGRKYPECNYIGIDIKGNRMWSGATKAYDEGLTNVRFLRTEIELLSHFFAPGELSELWLTFPDPQMKKRRKRLTATNFLSTYKKVLKAPMILNLKSDSKFLYTYTKLVAEANGLSILEEYTDVHNEADEGSVLRRIETYYESQWRARGIDIKYLRIALEALSENPVEPDVEIEMDSYRSYSRNKRSELESTK